MASQFDTETHIEPTADPADGRGEWSTHLTSSWNIGTNPNGGYLVSPVLRAMRTLGAHPDPMTVTTHYLRPGTGDASATVEAELVRTGRTVSTARGRLIQDGKGRIETIAAFTDLSEPGDVPLTIEPPDMPPPGQCRERSGLEQGVDLPILNRVDVRLHPDQATAGQAEAAVVSGWIRFLDDRPVDTLALPLFADAFPPSVFGSLGYVGWVPTIELTVHVRRRPEPGWVLARFETTDLSDNRIIEDGVLWDSAGNLIAQSRQVGLLLTD